MDKEEEEEAKASPEPAPETLWDDIYVKGSAPMYMRGRERLEVRSLYPFLCQSYESLTTTSLILLDSPQQGRRQRPLPRWSETGWGSLIASFASSPSCIWIGDGTLWVVWE